MTFNSKIAKKTRIAATCLYVSFLTLPLLRWWQILKEYIYLDTDSMWQRMPQLYPDHLDIKEPNLIFSFVKNGFIKIYCSCTWPERMISLSPNVSCLPSKNSCGFYLLLSDEKLSYDFIYTSFFWALTKHCFVNEILFLFKCIWIFLN